MKLSKTLLIIPALSLLGAAALGAGACSSSSSGDGLTWTASTTPSSDAVSETDACAALTACCDADSAGNLYCDVTGTCDDAFQSELNYGYCSGFTYSGYTVIDVTEPSSPPTGGDDAGTTGDDGGTTDDASAADDGGTTTDDASTADDGGTTTDDASTADDSGTSTDDAGGTTTDDAGAATGDAG